MKQKLFGAGLVVVKCFSVAAEASGFRPCFGIGLQTQHSTGVKDHNSIYSDNGFLNVSCCILPPMLVPQGLHGSVKQIVTSTPRASEAYISVEGRAKMILNTIAATPLESWPTIKNPIWLNLISSAFSISLGS